MKKIIFLNFFSFSLVLFGFQTEPKVVDLMKNVKENQIYIKLFRNLSLLKLFNLYNDK